MRIKQVEELVGITKKNIRFYEDQHLLIVARAENGYREYDLEEVKRLKEIKFFRKLNISIEHIQALFEGEETLEHCLKDHFLKLEEQKERVRRMQDFCERLIEEKISLATLNADLCLEQMEQMEKEGVEFMDVHKNDVHRKKKRGAILGALAVIVFIGSMLCIIAEGNRLDPAPLGVLIFFGGFAVLVIIGVTTALIGRLKEIQGGEEDEAGKY